MHALGANATLTAALQLISRQLVDHTGHLQTDEYGRKKKNHHLGKAHQRQEQRRIDSMSNTDQSSP